MNGNLMPRDQEGQRTYTFADVVDMLEFQREVLCYSLWCHLGNRPFAFSHWYDRNRENAWEYLACRSPSTVDRDGQPASNLRGS